VNGEDIFDILVFTSILYNGNVGNDMGTENDGFLRIVSISLHKYSWLCVCESVWLISV